MSEEDPRKIIYSVHNVLAILGSFTIFMGALMPILWLLLGPFVVSFLTNAMADELDTKIEDQIAPTENALRVIIQNSIAELEDNISKLEYKKASNPTNWKPEDAQTLTNERRRLRSQQMALAALEEG